MRTANYTDLRANLKGYIDSVIDDCETVIVNRGKGSGVVMISLDEYNSLKETEYILTQWALFVKERKILRMVMPSPRMKEKALMIS